ncbi:sugar phosphate isomerase/epimerase family protein [Fictibacillus phosphorivorans]|uniref:sugar phosphate isomerase/epimerase family protein n=1 Tax=Fictibacillus phosphorivorans TaxID=1221500 RepID=UPI00203F22A4|nr:sugar phosphate isomerase/epimerase [Fictibacillus phosphorivorans]MCM3720217.1 sugar phosphate isomerase/epimerase [Fictibacillus phosphorivorans]MCM3777896.1 sugar phosphate isomerase/epimerase [Fictibacillus phosphorivorans]
MIEKFGVQLYTLRHEMEQDLFQVLTDLKKMGWSSVQISALSDKYDPKEVAQKLKELNLKAAGMHVPLNRLEYDMENVLREAHLYETRDIVCPYLSEELRTVDSYQHVKQLLNSIVDNHPDIRVSYHNHDFEFQTMINGQTAIEYLLDPAESNKILAEIDIYWVKKAGRDPLQFIDSYKNRMPIIHLKDMTNDEEETYAALGTGSIDVKPIIEWGEKSGIEWYVVEQDECPGDPFDSLQISYNYIQRLLGS